MATVVASQQFLAAEAKGRRLFAALEQKLRQSGSDVRDRDIDISYHQESFGSSVDFDTQFVNALDNENIQFDGWTHVSVSDSTNSQVAYSNYFCPREGGILCFDNDKDKDGNEPGDRIEWSDLMYHVYEQQAIEKQQPMSKLRIIWRFHIVNSETRRIIGEAKTFGAPNVGPFFTEYTRSDPRDSGFFALLGKQSSW